MCYYESVIFHVCLFLNYKLCKRKTAVLCSVLFCSVPFCSVLFGSVNDGAFRCRRQHVADNGACDNADDAGCHSNHCRHPNVQVRAVINYDSDVILLYK